MAPILIPLEEFAKGFRSHAEAAEALGIKYATFQRWIKRQSYAHQAYRWMVEQKGVELPRP